MKAFSLDARIAQLEREVRKLRADAAGQSGYLNLAAAASYLGVSVETMKYYVHRKGLFPTYKIGLARGHLALRLDDLDAYMERRRTEPESTPKSTLHVVRA